METVPATMSRSDWRGEKRITSAPKRERSYQLDTTLMNSMAQQAVPNGSGQSEFLRHQFSAAVSFVVTKPSSPGRSAAHASRGIEGEYTTRGGLRAQR